MLLLPQLNYIGTILLPDDSTLTEIGELMDNFVVQGLNMSKKRLYTKPEMGGIGLFGLKDFLTALQCTVRG